MRGGINLVMSASSSPSEVFSGRHGSSETMRVRRRPFPCDRHRPWRPGLHTTAHKGEPDDAARTSSPDTRREFTLDCGNCAAVDEIGHLP